LLKLLWWREQAGQRQLAAELAAARAAAKVATRPVVVATAPAASAPILPGGVVLIEAVPYAEAAFSGARVEQLQRLLDRLIAQGFRGSVQITSYPGQFCLSGSADVLAPAGEETPAAKCEQMASPPDSAAPAQHQSLAFANMIAAAQRASAGAIDVQLLAGDVADVAQDYPALADTLSAGQWNRIAAANHRVEVRIVPAAAAPAAP
jgi:hypothetical protein